MARWTAVRPQVRQYVRAATQGNTKESFRWVMGAAGSAGRDLRARSIEVPTLITRGARDLSGAGRLTAMTAPGWVRRDPGARYIEIPDAEHQAHQDRPEVFNELLLAFLREVFETDAG